MYKAKKLKPSSLDLYAARCAILHTLTPESDLSNNRKALQVAYAWGDSSINDLEASINLSDTQEITCVHINDLFESFKLGLLLFLELNKDNEKCLSKINRHFATLSKDAVQTYNKIMS